MQDGKWLKAAAIGTWILSGIYPLGILLDRDLTVWPSGTWLAAYAVNGVAMALFLTQTPGVCGRLSPVFLALTQSITGALVHALSGIYLDGTGVTVGLLVIVAAQIPFILPAPAVWSWIAVQTAMVGVPYAVGGLDIVNLTGITLAMGGFQTFAAVCTMLLRREQASRVQLAATISDLLATRALLAEHSRAAERLRISRDLHDTLGHHLTALSLQLDVAARLIDGGKAADHVRQAHAITRLLLADVRDVVGSLRESGHIDVATALRALTVDQTGLAVHADLPAALTLDDRERAETLIRCVQEIITNTMRHSDARNLWIRIEARSDGIAIHAHDDGRGAESIDAGHGLIGMRERFEQNAGHVDFEWAAGRGFQVHGFLPLSSSA